MPFADVLEIEPLVGPVDAEIRVPGSKSITNRALVMGALSDPVQGCELHGVLQSEDTEFMVEALRSLGFRLRTDWTRQTIHVCRGPSANPIPARSADLFVGNSGTTMRFLTALVSLGQGSYRLDGVARMRERPIEELLAALRQLGVSARSECGDGRPPVVVEARGLAGGSIRVRCHESSQFLSGLLMAAPLAEGPTTIALEGPLVSQPYVAMTVAMMRHFGVTVATEGKRRWQIPGNQWYRAAAYDIEADATAAGYFFAAAAICGGSVRAPGLPCPSLQGDVAFAKILDEMGCSFIRSPATVTRTGHALNGVNVDMNECSDCVMTLAAVACFANSPTTIRNVAHIRHKETDRLGALATELRRVGAEVRASDDGLTIVPRPLHGATVETYNDHRMAMSMALIGLRVPEIRIRNPGCVAKTYPGFFQDLKRLPRPSAGPR
jgi:3-phosphoshikimate 1-carboxyvinyltransferase